MKDCKIKFSLCFNNLCLIPIKNMSLVVVLMFEHTAVGTYFVPLQFWFCRNPGLALPLIALQYHEVKVKLYAFSIIALNSALQILQTSNLWVDYIYLDTDERRRFAQQSHEYLIEQVQHQSFSEMVPKVRKLTLITH